MRTEVGWCQLLLLVGNFSVSGGELGVKLFPA